MHIVLGLLSWRTVVSGGMRSDDIGNQKFLAETFSDHIDHEHEHVNS